MGGKWLAICSGKYTCRLLGDPPLSKKNVTYNKAYKSTTYELCNVTMPFLRNKFYNICYVALLKK